MTSTNQLPSCYADGEMHDMSYLFIRQDGQAMLAKAKRAVEVAMEEDAAKASEFLKS